MWRRVRRVGRGLDAVMGTGDGARSRRWWLVPIGAFVGTILAFLLIGTVTSAPLVVSLPNGAMIGLMMAVLIAACVSPTGNDGGDWDGPDHGDDTPVLGSPGGPWVVVAHLGPAPSAPDARDTTLLEV